MPSPTSADRPVLQVLDENHKIAHYYYRGSDKELAVYAAGRLIWIRDGKDVNRLPIDPIYSIPHPFPGSGDSPFPDVFGLDFSYETLGLYYGYKMLGTGWSGDC